MDPCWAHKDEAQGSVCSPESQAHKNEQRRWMLCLPLHDGISCGATARHTAAPQLTSFLPALLQPHVGLRAQSGAADKLLPPPKRHLQKSKSHSRTARGRVKLFIYFETRV